MVTSAGTPEFDALLDFLKRNRGFDFSGYKRATLQRRITKRTEEVGVASFGDYIDFLEVHPDEFDLLFNTILINVTTFFRDPEAWQSLARNAIPAVLEARRSTNPVRVWSAGAASGEEAYTVAMLLAEAMGMEAFRQHVKIYGTDIDEDALSKARRAVYHEREVEGIPPELLEKYMERVGDQQLGFRKDLRRAVIFGRHNIIDDAPISRLDLLICRNTLMYLNSETQGRIVERFQFALREGGFLFLGKAETLLAYSAVFAPLDVKSRIFAKTTRVGARDHGLGRRTGSAFPVLAEPVTVRDALLDTGPVAQVAIDAEGILVFANAAARNLFRLSPDDAGRPLQDLEISYRPLELRSQIEQARTTGELTRVQRVAWTTAGRDTRYVDVEVVPMFDPDQQYLGASVSMADVTALKRLQDEVEHVTTDLSQAYEQLQSTNEEFETSNEELQSTIEELETTNEELQSTNEELETMNEELQSTNEELETLNVELAMRGEELNELGLFFRSVLNSVGAGIVVVDEEMLVRVWNERAEDLWGLRADEVVGRHFLNLDIGLPVERLHSALLRCLAGDGGGRDELSATNRRGRSISCTVSFSALVDGAQSVRGVIMLMDDATNRGESPLGGGTGR